MVEAPDAAAMQAMLSSIGTMPGAADGGMPAAMPQPDPNMAQGSMPQIDPNMAQAYMQMFQYLQQGLSQQNPLAGAGLPGVPPMFPGLPPANPYAASGIPPEPAISVSVEGMKFQYQLTEDDLHKVFGRYGAVSKIRVDEAGASAVIVFSNFPDAQAAMNDLNGKVLNGLDGTLRINWLTPTTAPSLPPPYAGMGMPGFPGWGFPPVAPPQPWPGASGPCASAQPPATPAVPVATAADKSPSSKSQRKYTCRFIIGIENDKDFQVARRIIGAKGANMKRIVRQTDAKLRLRGVGSGYFEGAGRKESQEPLQLCISCTSQDHYKIAVKGVEDLLRRVYDEYRQWCQENAKPIPELEINFTENQLVYSSSSRAPLSGGAVLDDDDGDDSPKDKKKGGKSRPAKREAVKTVDGEVERGEPGPNAPPVDEIEKLIDDRNEARRANNFPEADRIRQLLHSRGVALMDEPGGRGKGAEVTTWRYWRD
eukprot:TRINITY_DN49905_c0_g1_i1.p1 TRINITY_DN49905_c0_g1~~TRINITY_DN49905_c0_g1_i1.p1  ORF type:complete len:481 (-),score=103.85 TRINITY_DN49905_c0_g1_i1:45-1487(-)